MRFEYEQFGGAFLAMRLHKLRVQITEQSDELFSAFGVEIPSACISVVLFLEQVRRANIAQIANATGYSHQLITQRLLQLESMSFIQRFADVKDKRKCVISLTRKGRSQANKLKPVLALSASVFGELSSGIGIDLDAALMAANQALDVEPLAERASRLANEGIPRTNARRMAHRK